jgi:hypothetical protein
MVSTGSCLTLQEACTCQWFLSAYAVGYRKPAIIQGFYRPMRRAIGSLQLSMVSIRLCVVNGFYRRHVLKLPLSIAKKKRISARFALLENLAEWMVTFELINRAQPLKNFCVVSISFSYYFPLTTDFHYHNCCCDLR